MSKLRLSVLDQSPVPAGSTPAQALRNSISLAQHVESLGFNRFWMSEHHAMDTLACSAPEIVLARIGGETSTIRIGSGGIMLPHYTPLKVAESFRTLHALYPGRVDLGIGRAPGGGPVEATALRRNRNVPQTDDFLDQLSELLAFLNHEFPAAHPFSRIKVSPEMPGSPDIWLLGSSMWSASTAAEFGLPYAFAHFFSPEPTRAALQQYRHEFTPNGALGDHIRTAPESMAAVGVICAETQAEADRLYSSVKLLQLRIRQGDRSPIASPEDALRELPNYPQQAEPGEFPRYVAGTPDVVKAALLKMSEALHLRELVVNTIVHDHEARLRSYTLLAEAFA
ncbi:LLM class flavin-dependent oxidoreductase [Granulicella rosea]|uniref:LLM class flavin-dependent oxidoreductase n=1 Tax=Granulicella rosea TaxID=474952 RepID=UPI003CCC3B20